MKSGELFRHATYFSLDTVCRARPTLHARPTLRAAARTILGGGSVAGICPFSAYCVIHLGRSLSLCEHSPLSQVHVSLVSHFVRHWPYRNYPVKAPQLPLVSVATPLAAGDAKDYLPWLEACLCLLCCHLHRRYFSDCCTLWARWPYPADSCPSIVLDSRSWIDQ